MRCAKCGQKNPNLRNCECAEQDEISSPGVFDKRTYGLISDCNEVFTQPSKSVFHAASPVGRDDTTRSSKKQHPRCDGDVIICDDDTDEEIGASESELPTGFAASNQKPTQEGPSIQDLLPTMADLEWNPDAIPASPKTLIAGLYPAASSSSGSVNTKPSSSSRPTNTTESASFPRFSPPAPKENMSSSTYVPRGNQDDLIYDAELDTFWNVPRDTPRGLSSTTGETHSTSTSSVNSMTSPQSSLAATTHASSTSSRQAASSSITTSLVSTQLQQRPRLPPVIPTKYLSILSSVQQCLVCNVSLKRDDLNAHLEEKNHLSLAANAPGRLVWRTECYYCFICRVEMQHDDLENHLEERTHKFLANSFKSQGQWTVAGLSKMVEGMIGLQSVLDRGMPPNPKSYPSYLTADFIATNQELWLRQKELEKNFEFQKSHQYLDGNLLTSTAASSSQIMEMRQRIPNGLPVYAHGQGLVLIINQEFKDNPKWFREGSQQDVRKLICTFSSFGYQIRDKHDLNFQGLISALHETRNILNDSPTRYSHLFVVIMSHGKDKKIMTTETDRWFCVEDLPEIFSKSACPGLSNRPSFFIIQACRGSYTNDAVSYKNVDDVRSDGPFQHLFHKKDEHLEPNKCDYLISYSCTADNPSYRDVRSGSFFISSLCETIEREYEKMHLTEMLMFVKAQFKDRRIQLGNNFVTQMPEDISTLSKNFYFRLPAAFAGRAAEEEQTRCISHDSIDP